MYTSSTPLGLESIKFHLKIWIWWLLWSDTTIWLLLSTATENGHWNSPKWPPFVPNLPTNVPFSSKTCILLLPPWKMKMKLWIYEIHIFELWNEEINVKKILAVINATYAVAKKKAWKNQACRDSNPIRTDSGFRFRDSNLTKVKG